MSSRPVHGGWQAPGPAGKAVTGSVVFGDVVQVSEVTGDVTVTTNRPPYRLQAFPAGAVALAAEWARAQPSRLLLPRHQVVPFTGRDSELADLAGWLGAGEAMSVRLVHAAGGHGKTRLAGHVAARCAAAGWQVWRASHNADTTGVGSRVELTASGVLVVVDYADRWPLSHLLALLTQLRDVHQQAGVVVRALLLARSAGFWWPALADRLDGDVGVPASALSLSSLGGQVDQVALFDTAARHFAAAMRVDSAPAPPDGLAAGGHPSILAVHMAALVAVDADHRGERIPAEPHALSAYLLRREYAHWQTLHARVEDRLQTPPSVMRRAVYVATLTGALSRADARDALDRAELASAPESADRIIDDHRFCYPPDDPATVLEALHPDRLGEDILALSTPGHPHAIGSDTWPPDDWVATVAPTLLVAADAITPTWAPAAVNVLVETAHRWPHVAAGVLYPLLRGQPELAIAAGGAALTRLADLPDVDVDVLEAVAALLPQDPPVDLESAAAAITAPLVAHRLDSTTDPAEHAQIHADQARRLANAGLHPDALAHIEQAVAIARDLADTDPGCLSGLADSLHNLGTALWEVGRIGEALAPTREALAIRRRLPGSSHGVHLPDLGMSMHNLGNLLAAMGRRADALACGEEAVGITRRLVDIDPDTYRPALAMSLDGLGGHLAESGRRTAALACAEEAVGIARDLADTQQRILADALHNLGSRLSDIGRHDAAREYTAEAMVIRRRLAAANPTAYLPDLAMSLHNLGTIWAEQGHPRQGLAALEEAVAIRTRLADAVPTAHLPTLARSLHNLGTALADAGRPQQGLAPIRRAVAIRRQLADTNPAHLRELANSLNNLGQRLAEVGRHKEAAARVRDAVAIRRQLAEPVPTLLPPSSAHPSRSPTTAAALLSRHLADATPSTTVDRLATSSGLDHLAVRGALTELAAGGHIALHRADDGRTGPLDVAQIPGHARFEIRLP